MSPVIVSDLDYSKGARLFGVIAKKAGNAVGLVAMNLTFQFSGSADEALDKVARKCASDPAFVERWRGWIFVAAEVNRHIAITDEGAVIRVKDEKETVVAMPRDIRRPA